MNRIIKKKYKINFKNRNKFIYIFIILGISVVSFILYKIFNHTTSDDYDNGTDN